MIPFRSFPAKKRLLRCARNDNPLPGIAVDCHCEERSDEAICVSEKCITGFMPLDT